MSGGARRSLLSLYLIALLTGALRSPAPERVPELSLEALKRSLNASLWPTYELSSGRPALPAALCEPPRSAQPLTRLLVMGDSRADRAGLGPSARWPQLSAEALKRGPQLLIHLGDWVTRGGALLEWRYALEAALGLGLPILTVRGNHDRGSWWAPLGLDGLQAAPPKPSPLRVTRVGAALIYMLDTEASEEEARAAVEAHLAVSAARPVCLSVRYTLWLQHRPLWSRGPHGSDERGWASWLVPALERLGVQLFLAGHDHNYERMRATRGVGAERRLDPSGPLYITSGGAGSVTAPLPDLSRRGSGSERARDQALSAVFSGAPHTLSLTLGAGQLTVEAWGSPRVGLSERIDQVTRPALP